MQHHTSRPTWPLRARGKTSPTGGNIASAIERNIEIVDKFRHDSESRKSFQDHLADLITRWSGSMLFVYLHVIWFAIWIALNEGVAGLKPFDPFPFGLLTTIVSLEAIFLSTFVLVSQNRQAALADRRNDLDLQINLLAEYEMTRVLTLVDALAKKLDIKDCDNEELAELEKDVEPEAVLRELERRSTAAQSSKNGKP
jgi:uncharacterized membrane protein